MRRTWHRLLVAAALVGALTTGGCAESVCPLTAVAAGISVTVSPDAAATVRTLTLRVCPHSGACSSHRVELTPDTATTSPRGTLVGFAQVAGLTTSDPATVVATVTRPSGKTRYPLRTVTPTVVQPDGPACGDEHRYAVTLDAQGLH